MLKKEIWNDIRINYPKIVMNTFSADNIKNTIKFFNPKSDEKELYDFAWQMLNVEVDRNLVEFKTALKNEYPHKSRLIDKLWIQYNESLEKEILLKSSKDETYYIIDKTITKAK